MVQSWLGLGFGRKNRMRKAKRHGPKAPRIGATEKELAKAVVRLVRPYAYNKGMELAGDNAGVKAGLMAANTAATLMGYGKRRR